MSGTLSKKDLTRLSEHIKEHGSSAGFVATPKRKHRNEESEMQRALIRWWQTACREYGVPELCLFSIPNGGNESAKRGSIMRLEGQRKGAPDLFLSVVRWHLPDVGPPTFKYTGEEARPVGGLYLELKTITGRLSPEQEQYHALLRSQGYWVRVVRALQPAQMFIHMYLTQP